MFLKTVMKFLGHPGCLGILLTFLREYQCAAAGIALWTALTHFKAARDICLLNTREPSLLEKY